jgi:hypothetical protein
MRIALLIGSVLAGCTASDTGGGGGSGEDPEGMVKIDGEGTVTVKGQGGSSIDGSPFTCGGGNCSTDVFSTTRSLTFTPAPATARATIEHGDGAITPVGAAEVIAVDPALGWILQVTFEM